MFICVFFTAVFAKDNIQKPPMPPFDLFSKDKKVQENPCSMIPPMLYKLPPPLLKLVDSCNNKNLKPTKNFVIKKLQKNGLLDKNYHKLEIKEVDGLSRFYKISYKKYYFFDLIKIDKKIFCDWKLQYCFSSPLFLK